MMTSRCSSDLGAALGAALLVVSLSGPALADTIYLTDGKTLENVTVAQESLIQVTYRERGKSTNKEVTSDHVLRIEFSKKPRLVDEADAAIDDGNLGVALDSFELFIDGIVSGENTKVREKWAAAYAIKRVLDVNMTLGDLKGAVRAAEMLIRERPDSRYIPYAHLTKIEALRWLGEEDRAKKTIASFKGLIDEKGLSNRWRLEADLAAVLVDSGLTASKRRDRLLEIGGEAGSEYPIVRNRARVAEGETYLEGDSKDFAAARKVFQRIADDPKADAATLAGAYTGLGDCLFQEGVDQLRADQDGRDTLKEALLNYLRVVVVYKDQTRYVQKALLYAGRAFDIDTSKVAARKMYRSLISDYPTSPWAEEAKKYL